VVIGEPRESVRVAKVVLVKKGDLYVSHLAPDIISGKHSYHESGVSHSYVDLINDSVGEGEPAGRKLRGMSCYLMVTSWGCPEVLQPTGFQPKPETKIHHTLIAPKSEIGWFCCVWAIERGNKGLAERISQTSPWPKVPVVASILADWTDPWILVTVCDFKSKSPYQVIQYSLSIPGRVPSVFVPEMFEGTWLENPRPKWRPGEPLPNEWLREAQEYLARKRARPFRR